MLAPIVLFVYNRPEHTKKTLESLMANDLADQSELFIYADGPKAGSSEDQLRRIKETRAVIREKNWCGKVDIIEREKNMGLANSIIIGVTEVINKSGKIIVLEDDLLLSKNFLKYMNDSLNIFENNEIVMQIAGRMFPVNTPEEFDAYFLSFTSSTGWATWKRVWDKFDKLSSEVKFLDKDKNLRKKFDLNGSYPYYKMLKKQLKGKVDSWAIRFYLNVFIKKGLVLFPRKSLVYHIGYDGSGIHCITGVEQSEIDDSFEVKNFCQVDKFPEIEKEIAIFLKSQNNIIKKSLSLLSYFLKRLKNNVSF